MREEKTNTRIALLEQNHITLMEKLIEFQEDNKAQHEEIKTMIREALEKKAGIWVEKVIIWFGAIAGAGILGYLGLQIIKVIEQL